MQALPSFTNLLGHWEKQVERGKEKKGGEQYVLMANMLKTLGGLKWGAALSAQVPLAALP